MNIIEKEHNYYFYNYNVISTSSANIFVNTINSKSYDLGTYNKTLIIVHDFMYKHDYMFSLINEIIKSNTRVIVFDLTGHNCVSELYKKRLVNVSDAGILTSNSFSADVNSIDEIVELINVNKNYRLDTKFFTSAKQNYYDFVKFNDISLLSKILYDYDLSWNHNENIFILSHSVGSLSVFSNLITSLGSWNNKEENFIKGVISLSPNLKDLRFQNKLFYNLLSFFWPGKLVNYDLKVSEGVEGLIKNDSMNLCSARSIKNIIGIQDLIVSNAKNITVPSLFFHAKDDQISSYDDSLKFFNELNTNEKQFISFDKGGHNLFLGDKSSEVINKINSWMIEKL